MSCANQPDGADTTNQEQVLMPRKRKVQVGTCVKCRTEKGRFGRLSVNYCKSCFFQQYHARICKSLYPPLTPSIPHKATSQPTNLRPLPQQGNVVLAVSGGAGSMSLLDRLVVDSWVGVRDGSMVDGIKALAMDGDADRERQGGPDKGSQRPAKQPLWRKGWVVHVDFSNLLPLSPNQSNVIRHHLESSYSKHNLDFHFVEFKIEDAFDESLAERISNAVQGIEGICDFTQELHIHQDPTQAASSLSKLRNLLSSVPPTSHPHILHQLLSSLLLLISASLSVTHLVTGETSTRLAQRIISSTANGGGWGLPLEMAGSRTLKEGGKSVMRLKPLRDTMVREAAYYCWVKKIETINANGWDGFVSEKEGKKSAVGDSRGKGALNSLERLTEDFINSLMVTHPSTVSTITRTGSKLQFRGARDDLETVCPLCGLPSEPSSIAWKARTALTALPRLQASGSEKLPLQIKEDALTESLCYACLTALEPALERAHEGSSAPMKELELPQWVHDRIHHHQGGALEEAEDGMEGHLVGSHIGGGEMSRDRMKEVVGEFLIDQDE